MARQNKVKQNKINAGGAVSGGDAAEAAGARGDRAKKTITKNVIKKTQLGRFQEVMQQKRRVHEAIEHVLGVKQQQAVIAAQKGPGPSRIL